MSDGGGHRPPLQFAADTAASTPQPFGDAMMFSTMRSVRAEIARKGFTSRADRMIDASATFALSLPSKFEPRRKKKKP